MTENNEEIIPLTSNISNHIQKYFNFNNNNIETIRRIGPYGEVELHVTAYNRNNAIFLLTNNALQSLGNIPATRAIEIRDIFSKNSNLFSSPSKVDDSSSDYIEWSLFGDDLIRKRQEFRSQIDLYKTYDNQQNYITRSLIEIIEYYLNQYLIEQEKFSKEETKKLIFYFEQAIKQKSYLIYFIKAYTLTNNFYHLLNKHLALYILDYFDTTTSYFYYTQQNYRLINFHIITLLINHPDIDKYQYRGITYRGLLMTQNQLESYSIGKYILNKSFVSTSKDRLIANIFADDNREQNLKIPVLLKYTIRLNRTAIDIKHISTIQDEKEVLILPFSVFQIKNKIKNTRLAEIHLEECEDDQLKNKTTCRKVWRKWRSWLIMLICWVIFISGIGLYLLIKFRYNSEYCSKTKWEQEGDTVAGGNGVGDELNQLALPYNIAIDDDQTIYITDWGNHRIVEWKHNATNGRIVAGGKGEGNETNQLHYPTNVIIDKENNSLIICDKGNERIMEWSRLNNSTYGYIIISDIACGSLAMDKDGSLYVSDMIDSEVIRWKREEKNREIVTYGYKGFNRVKFSYPGSIFVDKDYSLYVSDQGNDRVMKWLKDAEEGIVVAGGNGKGNNLTQLFRPAGISVDQFGSVYVADWGNSRVMRWCKGAKTGTIVVGENKEQETNQFIDPIGISFDLKGNLYVVDQKKDSVLKFNLLM